MCTKTCGKCKTEKSKSEFRKKSDSKDGLAYQCKSCADAYHKKYIDDNRTSINTYNQKWKQDNKEQVQVSGKRYYQENKEQRAEYAHKWGKANRDIKNASYMRYMTRKEQAMPSWANEGYIKLFYTGAKIQEELTGRKVHVDHIVPLHSELVCGLHCEDNLQWLFAEDNLTKSNSFVIT